MNRHWLLEIACVAAVVVAAYILVVPVCEWIAGWLLI